MDFRENLTRLRLERHLTQLNLAEMVGVGLNSVVQWENGDSEPPLKDLVAISDALGVSVDQLLGKAEPQAETAAAAADERAGEVVLCPCCGREVQGSICLACEFPMTGYEDKGPRYAITCTPVHGSDYYGSRAEVIKYCGLTDEEKIDGLYSQSGRKLLKRDLSDVAVHWITARINPKNFYLRIVEDLGEPEEELINKPEIIETPSYLYKDNSIGVGGIILIVVLTIIVLSIF